MNYVCTVCGYVYEEAAGSEPDVASGTPFENIPDSWTCPLCGVAKDQFQAQ